MINNYELMAIPGSMKQFKNGILSVNRKTGQFGTIQEVFLRGKNARKNLRDKFRPVQFAVVDPSATVTIGDPVVVTLRDGDREITKHGDILSDMIMITTLIIIPPQKIMQTKVGMSRSASTTEFRYCKPSLLAKLLDRGGRIVLQNPTSDDPIICLDVPLQPTD